MASENHFQMLIVGNPTHELLKQMPALPPLRNNFCFHTGVLFSINVAFWKKEIFPINMLITFYEIL